MTLEPAVLARAQRPLAIAMFVLAFLVLGFTAFGWDAPFRGYLGAGFAVLFLALQVAYCLHYRLGWGLLWMLAAFGVAALFPPWGLAWEDWYLLIASCWSGMFVAGYSMCQRSSTELAISSGFDPLWAIAITMSRHCRYGDFGCRSLADWRTISRGSFSRNARLTMPAMKTAPSVPSA